MREISIAHDGDTPKEGPLFQLACQIRQLVNTKWDGLSTDILQNMASFPVEDEENFKIILQADGHKVGIWANSTKNPR